jgi:hypothetical protein
VTGRESRWDWADTFLTRATCRSVMIDMRKTSHVNDTIR